MEVTAPITLASFLTRKSLEPTLARVPSPDPRRRSPLDRSPMQLIPWEKSLLFGPILLNKSLSREISMISPVLVPRYAKESVGSMTQQVKTLLI